MPSVFTHAIAGYTLGRFLPEKYSSSKLLLIGIVCSMLPDIDGIGFWMGIPYDAVMGHRGFTHSILFAFLLSIIVMRFFYPSEKTGSKYYLVLLIYFMLATVSHGLMDALTSGGRGVAFFSPFDNTRYFFPWRSIKVSPMSLEGFFSGRGLSVIKSEFLLVWIPCILILFIKTIFKKKY